MGKKRLEGWNGAHRDGVYGQSWLEAPLRRSCGTKTSMPATSRLRSTPGRAYSVCLACAYSTVSRLSGDSITTLRERPSSEGLLEPLLPACAAPPPPCDENAGHPAAPRCTPPALGNPVSPRKNATRVSKSLSPCALP
jgi:hypothetical protein